MSMSWKSSKGCSKNKLKLKQACALYKDYPPSESVCPSYAMVFQDLLCPKPGSIDTGCTISSDSADEWCWEKATGRYSEEHDCVEECVRYLQNCCPGDIVNNEC
jgi:hypothetical protein